MTQLDKEMDGTSQWSRVREAVGVVAWSSFLGACIETMLFFACFDPQLLANDDLPQAWLAHRPTAYAVGFFFFWACSAIAAAFTAYLIESGPHASDAPNSRSQ
jgi:hypothetical protein